MLKKDIEFICEKQNFGFLPGTGMMFRKQGGAGRKQRKKFSLKEFLRETAAGGITGGVASAGFYGAGKGIKALRNNLIGDITLVNNEYRVNGGKMIVFKPKI